VSILQATAPTLVVVPTAIRISILPLSEAISGRVALSDSISAIS